MIEWKQKSRNFWTSATGRFDKMMCLEFASKQIVSCCDPKRPGLKEGKRYDLVSSVYFVVYDWDYGKSRRFRSEREADNWCWSRWKSHPDLLTADGRCV